MYNKTNCTKEEKAISGIRIQTVFVSMFAVFLCLIALCSTSWAWFNDSTYSGNNVIESGSLDCYILLNDLEVKETEAYTINVGEYTVKVSISDNSTATKGFCKIIINEKTYITSVIEKDSPVELKIDLKLDKVSIKFETVWGIPSNPNISNNTIVIE